MKRSTLPSRLALLLPALLVASGVAVPQQTSDDVDLAQKIAEGLIAACPRADPTDEKARDQSAEKLTRFTLLRDSSSDPIYWGGHTAGKSYAPEASQATLFNPLVWRRIYLSLFMFPGQYRIERADSYLLLRLPYQFRNGLDPGAYPYPFWHSKQKWDSYQLATELILVFQNGKILAGYRSESQDPGRPYLPRVWDGQWHWIDRNGQEQPYVALYTYLFSPANPHEERLDAAYRALEAEARQYNCAFCHSPSNPAQMNPLRLLNFPNQALTVRHQIVTQIEQNLMPLGEGIPDSAQRQKLLELARTYAEVGDQALDYEGEFKPQSSH
jgi:hypothetical protein